MEPKTKLVCIIDKKTEIWADRYQYILRYDIDHNSKQDNSKKCFFSDLTLAFQEMLNNKIKKYAIADKRHSLESLGDAIKKARKYIEKRLKPLLEEFDDKKG